MPPKKGETECKNKEDFSLLQILGKVFYPAPGSPPGFLSESGCKSTAFFRTRKLNPAPGSPPGFLSESGCKSTAFFRTRKLITHFFWCFFEFIFKRIVIQPFTDEWFLMKGLRCTEPYTLLYYIRGKKKNSALYGTKKEAGWKGNPSRMKLESH